MVAAGEKPVKHATQLAGRTAGKSRNQDKLLRYPDDASRRRPSPVELTPRRKRRRSRISASATNLLWTIPRLAAVCRQPMRLQLLQPLLLAPVSQLPQTACRPAKALEITNPFLDVDTMHAEVLVKLMMRKCRVRCFFGRSGANTSPGCRCL
jgi:hypothetical protein